MTDTAKKLSGNEAIKRESNYLRGNIAAELADANDYVSDPSYELLKFHGSYQGYDRDTATARKKQGLDKEWEFMLRLKMPGGRLTAEQYLALDALCDERANGSLRITTRQTFQFHQIVKKDLKPFIASINRILLSTLGGCGDVVRNVITCPAPIKDTIHARLEEDCFTLARHMAPKSDGYFDLWLDGEKIENYPFSPAPSTTGEVEPLYTSTYMPRKFKIAIGQPEDNCMDALCNDLALMTLFDGQELQGYNVALGGGLGMKHNTPRTYPYLAQPTVFVKPQDMVAISESVVKLQRDHGDRTDRQHARLKYVVAEKGVEWCKAELEKYMGKSLDAPKPIKHWEVIEHIGWHEQGDGKWFLGIPIPSGRIKDKTPSPLGGEGWGEGLNIRTALREVISTYKMPLRLTNDQNLLLCDIEAGEKQAIAALFKKYNIPLQEDLTHLQRNLLACVAYPTCGKALAEAERVQTPIETSLQNLFNKYGVGGERIAIRIAGCPNGCSRPYVGDIGIVGRTPDHYALYIGGDFQGTRLNTKTHDKVHLDKIAETLEPFVARYKTERTDGEAFGNFWHRVGIKV